MTQSIRIGFHAPIAGGLQNALLKAREHNCDTVQMFSRNPRDLAAADETIREKSVASFREELERGVALGADYLVVHPGSAKNACEADGIRTCAESLQTACAD